jgi:hypothetical protein
MADTFTTHYNLTKPQIGGDPDTWGNLLNGNFDTIDSQLYTASTYALPLTGGTLTSAGSNGQGLTVADTTSYAGIQLKAGNGATTPNKTIRVSGASGNLEIVNSAYSTVIATLSDTGNLALLTGGLTTNNLNVNGTPIFNSGSAEVDVLMQYNNAAAHRVYFSNSGSTGNFAINFTDASGNYAGTGITMSNTNGTVGVGYDLNVSGHIQTNSTATNAVYLNGGQLRIQSGSYSKYFRMNSSNDNLEIVNNAYSAVISSLTDAGVWSAADFQATSDEHLKDRVQPLRRGVDELKRMPPREYIKYADESKTGEGREEIGFLAQEARKVIPEAVTEGDDGYLRLSYGQVTALLARAILEIDARLELAGL